MALLEIKDLAVDFTTERGVIRAVRGCSLSLDAGETLAVVGESGCGKTVLCKSIPGLLPARGRISSGEILYGGQNLAALPERELNRLRGGAIALLSQNPSSAFNPVLPIGGQIAEPLRIHRGTRRAQAKARAIEWLGRVGLDQPERRYGQYPHQLSGGMLQRAALAAALICEPEILIADEPTTALDVTVQSRLLGLLSALQKKTGVSILLITHDLGVAAQAADRIAVMYAGRLVETGTAREVFHDPRHPYTWGLLESLPTAEWGGEAPRGIPGAPPELLRIPRGDAFAPRSRYALGIDYREEPPLFHVGGTHYAATWLLHPNAPKLRPPVRVEKGRVVADG